VLPLLVPKVDYFDRGVFVSVAERLLAGDTLYAQVFDNKEAFFYYFVVLQRAISPLGDFIAELVLLTICIVSSYSIALGITSRKVASITALVEVPIILTGHFYLPGFTHLPGISLTLAACALCFRGRPALAGVCVGILVFVKIILLPVALPLSGCYLIARRRFGEIIVFASASAFTIAAALFLLHLRSELWPFVETLKANLEYSHGGLVEAPTALSSLKLHLSRIYTESLFVFMLGITLALLAALLFLSAEQYRHPGMVNALCCCVLAVLSAFAVLAVTGMWPHHNQILYIAAVFAALCLTPLFELTFMRARLLTLCLMATAAILLSGSMHPNRYLRAFKSMPKSIVALRELSPETQRLLASGPPGTYARVGMNDDQGHAFGLGEWQLACPKFHQYYFQPATVLNETFNCISTVPTLIVAESIRPVDIGGPWPDWDEFVARLQRLLAADYTCDADEGLRICQRTAAPPPSAVMQ
jgi:hypothetical protein